MKYLLALLISSALALTACSATEAKGTIGSPAPALSGLKWIQGGPVEIKKGQVTVVDFWATWCPPCRTSIPHLNEIHKTYSKTNVVLVGISNESAEKVKAFVKQMGEKMTYPVAIGSEKVQAGYMDAFGVNGIPHAFVVDADGKVAWHGHPMDNLEKAIDAALAAGAAKAPSAPAAKPVAK